MRTLQTVIYFLTQFMSIKLDILGYSISPVSYTHLTLPTNREV